MPTTTSRSSAVSPWCEIKRRPVESDYYATYSCTADARHLYHIVNGELQRAPADRSELVSRIVWQLQLLGKAARQAGIRVEQAVVVCDLLHPETS